MKVLFVDVGQGTCQVILLGNQRAIVIDAGASPEIPVRLLSILRITTIELLVLSHSHLDHSGGIATRRRHRLRGDAITGLLVAYEGAIDRIAYVYDSEFRHRPVGRVLCQQLRERKLRPEQLESFVVSSKPYRLWKAPNEQTVLAAISPLGGDHLQAFDEDKPNASSAILELRHAGNRIVFAADSEYQQWREVHRLRANRPIDCKVLTMPHHGGNMMGTAADLQWYCNHATRAEVVVVSVATANQHGHPKREVIQAISSSGSHVMCTQITEQCCTNLEPLRPGVIGLPLYPCRSSTKADRTSGSRRSRNVACAGTISAVLAEKEILVERVDDHRRGVANLIQSDTRPMCR